MIFKKFWISRINRVQLYDTEGVEGLVPVTFTVTAGNKSATTSGRIESDVDVAMLKVTELDEKSGCASIEPTGNIVIELLFNYNFSNIDHK